MSVARAGTPHGQQTVTGLLLATGIVASWLTLHLYAMVFYRFDATGLLLSPLLIALLCWLNVGLFIVAHDCMHGSLAPFRPRVNLWVGRLCLGLYAGFSYDALLANHLDHHRFAGTDRDPDFNDEDPEHFWRWYSAFLRRYMGWRSFVVLAAISSVYQYAFGFDVANVLLLWALPAILSSLQLFFFGTYLPHRHEDGVFADRHNARSNDYPWALSLLTCFHFGYHHEHHVSPHVPWWRLPAARQLKAR